MSNSEQEMFLLSGINNKKLAEKQNSINRTLFPSEHSKSQVMNSPKNKTDEHVAAESNEDFLNDFRAHDGSVSPNRMDNYLSVASSSPNDTVVVQESNDPVSKLNITRPMSPSLPAEEENNDDFLREQYKKIETL